MNVPRRRRETDMTALGWREWVCLPDWSIDHIKAKVDTGARTSSIHAFDLEWFERNDLPWVRFTVQPWQRSDIDATAVECAAIDVRHVKSSSGEVQKRPVVITDVVVSGQVLPVELTLTRRDDMGFRMLLGRQALRGHFLVDSAASYRGGRPPRAVRARNRGTA